MSKIYKELMQFNSKNPHDLKMIRRSESFFQRIHTDGLQAHEKMFNIINHQRNANQNHNEISPHTCQNGHHKKITNNKCGWWCGEKGTLVHCWWKCKLVQPPWKTAWRFLKKLRTKLPYDPVIPLPGRYQKKKKSH